MKFQAQQIATALTVAIFTFAVAILVLRGGLIAWAALLLSVALFAKLRLRPSGIDLPLSISLIALLPLCWFGVHRYVISTWESGEVVELTVNTDAGAHTARVWVMDIGNVPHVYYDAAPGVAAALLNGAPVIFKRGDALSEITPEAIHADALAANEAQQILKAMQTKYAHRNDAATIYYLMLGRARDRVPLVIRLPVGR